jgi:hypothetical protein
MYLTACKSQNKKNVVLYSVVKWEMKKKQEDILRFH